METYHRRLAAFAWGVLAYNMLVVVWGALVRATGSGDGCGAHWPLCHGNLLPYGLQLATLIEYGHRITSGLAFVLVVALLVWARRSTPRGTLVRAGAGWSMVFMISESVVGAALVLLSLVGENTSAQRAVWMVVHLGNTFLLLGALALTAWWAGGGGRLHVRRHGLLSGALALALLGLLWLGMSGALAALANTLFPTTSLHAGLQADFAADSPLLLRLRVLHPIIAMLAGLYVLVLVQWLGRQVPTPTAQRLCTLIIGGFCAQLVVGALNIALFSPLLVQALHLFLAASIWIALVVLVAETLAQPAPLLRWRLGWPALGRRGAHQPEPRHAANHDGQPL